MPSSTVVIPAHNEANVIGRLLAAIEPAAGDDLEVHVVCNGCQDETAAVARGFAGVTVHELPEASKIAALNLGDRMAGDRFPRLYVDADVVVDRAALKAVAAVLAEGEVLAAAPELRVALEGRPRVVRGFYEVFLRTPWATRNAIGSGFYGLSREGRERFGDFPDVINDDLFVRSLFRHDERMAVPSAHFTIEAPRTTWALVKAKARVAAGTREFIQVRHSLPVLAASTPESAATGPGLPRRVSAMLGRQLRSPLWRMARDRQLRGSVGCFLFVRLGAALLARAQRLRGGRVGWGQDRTTRVAS